MCSLLRLTHWSKTIPSTRLLTSLPRHLATQAPTSAEEQVPPGVRSDAAEWRVIYHLPLIRLASAFNRVKLHYGVANAITIPAAYALEQASQVPAGASAMVAAIGLSSLLTLAIFSVGVRNLVGIIYVNPTDDQLKIAYVDYWGRRQHVYVAVKDLKPEWEQATKGQRMDFYQPIRLYSDSRAKYKLLQRYGRIDDPYTFYELFGE